MNVQLDYTQDELLADPEIAEPLFAAGRRCHGGFDAEGRYVSPRTKNRMPAIAAWQARHEREFDTTLLDLPLDTWPEQYPNLEQSKYLLSEGVREPIISSLTRIGTVEGFGSMLRFVTVADIGRFFDDDIAGTATAHLNGGLFEAHARDEAGHLDVAGHDEMWYAARDIAFENPVTEDQTAVMLERMGISGGGGVPDAEHLARQAQQLRQFDRLDFGLEMLLHRMVSLLFIEIQAFHTFAWAEDLLSDDDLVAGEGEAARLVSFIRRDETPHVEYLRTTLTEMRDRTVKLDDGTRLAGGDVVGRLWEMHLDASLGQRRRDFLQMSVREVEHALAGQKRADSIIEEFHARGSIRPGPDGVFHDTGVNLE